MENNLDSIIEGLKHTTDLTRLNIDDNVLFEKAVKIFISNNISNQKNIKNEEEPKQENKDYPTEKQIEFLAKNKINAELMTRKEATKKIQEIINRGENGRYRK